MSSRIRFQRCAVAKTAPVFLSNTRCMVFSYLGGVNLLESMTTPFGYCSVVPVDHSLSFRPGQLHVKGECNFCTSIDPHIASPIVKLLKLRNSLWINKSDTFYTRGGKTRYSRAKIDTGREDRQPYLGIDVNLWDLDGKEVPMHLKVRETSLTKPEFLQKVDVHLLPLGS